MLPLPPPPGLFLPGMTGTGCCIVLEVTRAISCMSAGSRSTSVSLEIRTFSITDRTKKKTELLKDTVNT